MSDFHLFIPAADINAALLKALTDRPRYDTPHLLHQAVERAAKDALPALQAEVAGAFSRALADEGFVAQLRADLRAALREAILAKAAGAVRALRAPDRAAIEALLGRKEGA